VKYTVKITSKQTHTIDVIANNRHHAIEKAEETLRHADADQYHTELESIAHVVMIEANGCEWTYEQTPDSKIWQRSFKS
jgi:hypothetical protein